LFAAFHIVHGGGLRRAAAAEIVEIFLYLQADLTVVVCLIGCDGRWFNIAGLASYIDIKTGIGLDLILKCYLVIYLRLSGFHIRVAVINGGQYIIECQRLRQWLPGCGQ